MFPRNPLETVILSTPDAQWIVKTTAFATTPCSTVLKSALHCSGVQGKIVDILDPTVFLSRLCTSPQALIMACEVSVPSESNLECSWSSYVSTTAEFGRIVSSTLLDNAITRWVNKELLRHRLNKPTHHVCSPRSNSPRRPLQLPIRYNLLPTTPRRIPGFLLFPFDLYPFLSGPA